MGSDARRRINPPTRKPDPGRTPRRSIINLASVQRFGLSEHAGVPHQIAMRHGFGRSVRAIKVASAKSIGQDIERPTRARRVVGDLDRVGTFESRPQVRHLSCPVLVSPLTNVRVQRFGAEAGTARDVDAWPRRGCGSRAVQSGWSLDLRWRWNAGRSGAAHRTARASSPSARAKSWLMKDSPPRWSRRPPNRRNSHVKARSPALTTNTSGTPKRSASTRLASIAD